MVESPNRGSSSSELQHKIAASDFTRLSLIATSSPLTTLSTLLGPDGDLHLVGGSVRDALLNKSGFDLDVATRLRPEAVIERLERAGVRVIPTGIEHGTVTAVIDSQNIEITTFRKPGPRTGSGFSTTIQEDLAGRDFTINAIAFCLATKSLIDPYDGNNDVLASNLRAVGTPRERFLEDPLRILRMIRFGGAQKRTIDPSTYVDAASLVPMLSSVSIERIRSELERILLSEDPARGIALIKELEILPLVLPEALASIGFEQNEFHVEDVFQHTLTVLSRSVPDKIVRLACLFHDLGKPASFSVDADGRRHFYNHEILGENLCEQAMRRLKFSNDDIDAVRKLVRYHMRPLECGPSAVRRLLRELGPLFQKWREVKIADAPPVIEEKKFHEALSQFDTMVDVERNRPTGSPFDALAVDGDDLKALGLKQGPAIGVLLKYLLDLVLEDPSFNQKETLLDKSRTWLAENRSR